MTPFSLCARQPMPPMPCACARRAGRQVSGRRHQPRRPDARDDRAARGAGRRDRPVARHRSSRPGRRPADRRGGAQHRGRRASRWCGRAIRCSPARSWRAHRRRSATWRPSAATCSSARAAPISTTTRDRAATSVTRARAATRSTASTASTPSSAPRTPASPSHPSDMCVALAALDAVVHLEGAAAARSLALTDLHRLPGDRPDIETTARAGRADHRGRAAGAAARRALDLSQGARPGELRLRARLGGGSARDRGRPRQGRAARAGRRRAQAVARLARPRRRCGGSRRPQASFRAAAEAELADARPLKDNGFKIELARRTIVAVLDELAGGEA